MKKLITLLLVSSLYFSWANAQEKPSIEKPKFGEHLSPGRPIFIKKDFPRHWGKPPEAQTRDFVDLPQDFGKGSSTLAGWIKENLKKDSIKKPEILTDRETQDRPKFIKKDFPRHWGKPPEVQLGDFVDLPKGFGKGSSTLAYWIKENLKKDSIKKPEILTDREKLDPRKHEAEVMGAVKEGRITREEAQKKLGALREEMEKKGEFKRPKRLQKPELSDSVKESISNIKSQQEALHSSMKAKLADLGKDASKEDMREAIEIFKAENKEKFDAIKEANEAIRESIEASRPAKPERPELTAELKVKVEALKEKEKALHTARKELNSQLKEASKEEKKTLISQFKENNKVKHEEIKTKSKEIKEEIRALVETEATRTSDL